MRRLILLVLASAIAMSCAGYGGGSAPAGGGAPAAPSAAPSKNPLPSGNPDVDNYGY